MSGGTPQPDSQGTSTGEAPATSPPTDAQGSPPATGSEPTGGTGESNAPGAPLEQGGATDQRSQEKGPEKGPDKAPESETRSDSTSVGSGSSAGGERSERSTAVDGPRAPSSTTGSSATLVSPDTGVPIVGGLVLPPASGPPGIADVGTLAVGGAGVVPGLLATDTGGMHLALSTPLGCSVIPCYGGSGGTLGSAVLASRLRDRVAGKDSVSEASERPLFPFLGRPGQPRGPFFSLLGGGGGATAGFMLFGLVAVLAGWLVRRIDWTTAFRIPAVAWPPSAYAPPIESPG
jgi:hypothetical protein